MTKYLHLIRWCYLLYESVLILSHFMIPNGMLYFISWEIKCINYDIALHRGRTCVI